MVNLFEMLKKHEKILTEGLRSKDKKIFSITGEKGIGKTTLLRQVQQTLKDNNFE